MEESQQTIPAATNIIVANFTPPPVDEQQIVIDQIMADKAAGTDFNVFDFAMACDITGNMKRVKAFCVAGGICDKAEWNAAVKASRIKHTLGIYPKTAVELVDHFIKRDRIQVDFQKRMKRTMLPTYEGHMITADDRQDRIIDALARVEENREINTETLKVDLRLCRDNLGMKFSDTQIGDAVTKWFTDATHARVWEVMGPLMASSGFKSAANRRAWEAVCSQFDLEEHDAEYVEAILSKFIWQVKRKALGLDITNHLMPVLIGPQGTGKSTFVTKYLLGPIYELTSTADFKGIEEERNMDQWRNLVLFLDEMQNAAKSDVDKVKNRITAMSIAGRPMRTNDNVQYRQNVTFIGCTNREMDQLIRDETGNRRFAALRYSSKPDWSKLDGVNMVAIWQSVDERGPDPTDGVRDQLRERQEATRERSDVELWIGQHTVIHTLTGKRQDAAFLYKSYKEWADEFSPGRVIDARMWGKEFNRLIKSGQVTGWTGSFKSNSKTFYQFG